ncbi:hypothetical protein [Phytohabitans aurantiacus]|uniref:hypothetical protein n=1 Tax=Phytohabitans aurantiacus TaxID=3016789 RepID=UPI0024912C5D|nr:hypothetical protein [Phytohabitans aurantiacus]
MAETIVAAIVDVAAVTQAAITVAMMAVLLRLAVIARAPAKRFASGYTWPGIGHKR